MRITWRRNSGRKECDAKLMDDAWATRIRALLAGKDFDFDGR